MLSGAPHRAQLMPASRISSVTRLYQVVPHWMQRIGAGWSLVLGIGATRAAVVLSGWRGSTASAVGSSITSRVPRRTNARHEAHPDMRLRRDACLKLAKALKVKPSDLA